MEYSEMTLFSHDNLILARYKEAASSPFVILDKETLKPLEDLTVLQFTESPLSRRSLAWTPLKTVYQEDKLLGNRWFRQAPFCSDGLYFYTLAHYKRKDFDSIVVRIVLEVYELTPKRELKFVDEQPLYKNDGETYYTGSKKRVSVNYMQ